MSNARAHNIGDTIISPIGNRGRVKSKTTDGHLTVEYYERGQTWEACYSPRWFERWGHMLTNLGRVPQR